MCLKLMAKREMAAAVISLQSPRDANRSFVVLRPGQTETISSPPNSPPFNRFSFPFFIPSYAEGKCNQHSYARSRKRLRSFGTCDFHRQQQEVAEGCCCPVLMPRWGPVQGWQRSGAAAHPAPTAGLLLPESLKAAPRLLAQVCLQGMPPK